MSTFVGIDGEPLAYLDHPYNAARTNERAVEVPVALRWVRRQAGRGLEVGNVLSHYVSSTPWTRVDRYEIADGVINVDIEEWDPGHLYNWAVSLSTFEHIGWDDEPRDPAKVFGAVSHLRSLLAPGGHALVSFPLGHHPELDKAADRGQLGL